MKTAINILSNSTGYSVGELSTLITSPVLQPLDCIEAMEEYSEQNTDAIYIIYNKPAEKLKVLHDLYRQENPDPKGRFYIPDRTKFYEWIVGKILNQK